MKGHRIPLPEGYGLFSHCKPQGEGKVREDVYLFGSKHTMKVGFYLCDISSGVILMI